MEITFLFLELAISAGWFQIVRMVRSLWVEMAAYGDERRPGQRPLVRTRVLGATLSNQTLGPGVTAW